jgi:hypothetical protein
MKTIMKQLLITLALLTVLAPLGSATTAHATLTTVPFDNGKATNTWTVFAAPFSDNIVLNWVDVAQNFACNGQNAPFLGFSFISVGAVAFPCAPVISYTFGPNQTWGECTGPNSLKIKFAGVETSGAPFSGTLSFKLEEYYGGSGRNAGCYGEITSGKLKLSY